MMKKQRLKAVFSWVLALIMTAGLFINPNFFGSTADAMRPSNVHLNHEGAVDDYSTIQAAIDDAEDGDTITVDAGSYREQLTITKNITLQGAGMGLTTIESPDTADLTHSGTGWKNLKNQDVFAVIGIKTDTEGTVIIKDLTVNGRDQGQQSSTAYPDANTYAFQGIGAYNSNVTIDSVKVTQVRELNASTPPSDYAAEQPSGMNHNEAIFAESVAGEETHTLTVENCYVDKYQKTAILAWGPTLLVDIHDNTIQGYGKTLYSTGNAIQIASSDRTGSGGSNGDRRGTSGSIKNNQILDIGIYIPQPAEPATSFNVGLGGSTGILVWEAGTGLVIEGNTIVQSNPQASWHSGLTSNDGGWSNVGIGVTSTAGISILNNTLSGLDAGIILETYSIDPSATVSGNSFSANVTDYWTGTGDDTFVLGNSAETIGYHTTDNGVDTLVGFGEGDKIYVTDITVASVNGMLGNSSSTHLAESDTPTVRFAGNVTIGDGSAVAAHSVELATSGGTTTLFLDTDGKLDAAELAIKLSGVYLPSNFALSGGYISFVPTVFYFPEDDGAAVLINGVSKTAGTAATTTGANGQTVKTLTVDPAKLQALLAAEKDGAIVTLPITGGADVAAGVLTGDMIKSMETKGATLVVKTDSASYTLPASEFDISALAKQFGKDIPLADITVTVQIAEPAAETVQVVANAAELGGFTLVVPALDFTVRCTYKGETVEVKNFDAYVERLVAIPDGVDPTKITTGIVVRPDGTTYHVPTQVTQINGKYYAVINSLTNSTYTVIWHPVTFADVSAHWAKDAINNMGSRMVVNGVGNGNFAPDRDMTRAEFAAIVVRALGLAPGEGDTGFADVSSSAWYAGYIEIAFKHSIVKGYDNGSFGPNDTITREQAMTMIARAIKITGLKANSPDVSKILASYSDGASVSAYAQESVVVCIDTGLVSGRGNNTLAPKSNITRAEVAVIVERLLQKSGLID